MASRLAPLFLFFCGLAAAEAPNAARPTGGTSSPFPAFVPPAVGVKLRFERKPSSGFVKLLRSEVEDIFRPAGLRLLWELPDGKAQLPVGVPVAIIELRGDCNSRPPNTRANGEAKNLPLGWTLVEEGEVMPYSVVDCDRISGTLAAWFNRAAESPARVGMYWRLMGRVAAHELMHALLRTTEHGRTDATRARVRSGDLLFGARLEPEEVAALRRLGQSRMRVAERSNRNTSPSAPVSSP